MAIQLNRKQQARIYTPRGYVPMATNIPFIPSVAAAAYSTGTVINIASGAVDLSKPLLGIKLLLRGRVTVGVANITALTPEGLLNLFNRIEIFGQHKILQSDSHPFVMDGATWAGILAMHKRRGFRVYISAGGGAVTLDAIPNTPYPASGFTGAFATNTFDFKVELPIYFYPIGCGALYKPGFMYRSEEWGDSLQINIIPGGQPTVPGGGGLAGSLGLSGAATTVAFAPYGGGAGNPTLDILGMPNIQGATTGLPAKTVPGLLSRTVTPRTTQVQATGNDQQIAQLQKRKTSRLYFKTGVSTNGPVYTALSDLVVSTLGIQVGSDKFPRNKVDWFHWKGEGSEAEAYVATDPVQGYAMMDFMSHGSPFGTLEGDNIDAGATFYVIGDTLGLGNSLMEIVQEQVLREPEGDLYNF